MFKNALSMVFVITSLFSICYIDADDDANRAAVNSAKIKINDFFQALVATGDIHKFCCKIEKHCKQCLKDPEFKKILLGMNFSGDQIRSFKKCMKKFIKASVRLIKVEARLKEVNKSLFDVIEDPIRLLRLSAVGHTPHTQQMHKKWDALMEEMKQNDISKQNA